MQTTQSEIRIAEAARTRILSGGVIQEAAPSHQTEPGYIAVDLEIEARPEQAIAVEKIIALYTSKDRATSESASAACRAVSMAGSFGELMRSHVEAWSHLWRHFRIEHREEASANNARGTLTLRLHQFHLLQTVSLNSIDLDMSAPARGLHGEAYRGHIFWDELFIFP